MLLVSSGYTVGSLVVRVYLEQASSMAGCDYELGMGKRIAVEVRGRDEH